MDFLFQLYYDAQIYENQSEVNVKSEVEWNREWFFRALKGVIILKISLEMRTVLCLV
jgi:hypothetical protein